MATVQGQGQKRLDFEDPISERPAHATAVDSSEKEDFGLADTENNDGVMRHTERETGNKKKHKTRSNSTISILVFGLFTLAFWGDGMD